MADEAGRDQHSEPNSLFKEQKRTTVISRLRNVYGDENIVVSEDQREVRCNSRLERGQKVAFVFGYNDLEDATEAKEVYQLSQIYNIPDDKLSKLYNTNGLSCLFLANLHIISVLRVIVDDLDITDNLMQGRVKRIRLMVPDLDLSRYKQIPEYPLTPALLIHWLPDAFWGFDYPERHRVFGDLDTRPILTESDLYSLLHEYGHGQEIDNLSEYPLLRSLSQQQLSTINGSMENIPSNMFNDQQKEYATYKLQSENNANKNAMKLLEDKKIRAVLFPGDEGQKRIDEYIKNQIASYSRFEVI